MLKVENFFECFDWTLRFNLRCLLHAFVVSRLVRRFVLQKKNFFAFHFFRFSFLSEHNECALSVPDI